MAELAEEMTADYLRNLAALGVDTIDHFPKATEHIAEIIEISKTLIDKGFAYAAEGDVCFDVAQGPRLRQALPTARVDSRQGEGGEMADAASGTPPTSPSGKAPSPASRRGTAPGAPGRPGWHIECSAMSIKLLGETFDIHGGGLDLMFPHHENELAQSECCHGKPFAKYWLHNGLMQASSEVGKIGGRPRDAAAGDQATQEAGKIAKSKGASAFSELLQAASAGDDPLLPAPHALPQPDRLRRGPHRGSRRGARRLLPLLQALRAGHGRELLRASMPPAQRSRMPSRQATMRLRKPCHAAAAAFSGGDGRRLQHGRRGGGACSTWSARSISLPMTRSWRAGTPRPSRSRRCAGTRCCANCRPRWDCSRSRSSQGAGDDALVGQLMSLLIELRATARKNKDFASADRIRKGLTEMGIVLEDRAGGTESTRKG